MNDEILSAVSSRLDMAARYSEPSNWYECEENEWQSANMIKKK
jgi:hypothetical protein